MIWNEMGDNKNFRLRIVWMSLYGFCLQTEVHSSFSVFRLLWFGVSFCFGYFFSHSLGSSVLFHGIYTEEKEKKNWGNARRIGWTCSEHFRLFRLSQIVLLIMRSNFVQWFSPSGRMLQPDTRIHSKVNVVWTRVEVRSDELHEWKWDRIYCQR